MQTVGCMAINVFQSWCGKLSCNCWLHIPCILLSLHQRDCTPRLSAPRRATHARFTSTMKPCVGHLCIYYLQVEENKQSHVNYVGVGVFRLSWGLVWSVREAVCWVCGPSLNLHWHVPLPTAVTATPAPHTGAPRGPAPSNAPLTNKIWHVQCIVFVRRQPGLSACSRQAPSAWHQHMSQVYAFPEWNQFWFDSVS